MLFFLFLGESYLMSKMSLCFSLFKHFPLFAKGLNEQVC